MADGPPVLREAFRDLSISMGEDDVASVEQPHDLVEALQYFAREPSPQMLLCDADVKLVDAV